MRGEEKKRRERLKELGRRVKRERKREKHRGRKKRETRLI
jgi:hypothetical protein